MVFRPEAGRVQHLGTRGHRRIEEGLYGGTIGRGEREVDLTEPLPGRARADPELGLRRGSEADHLSEVHDPLPAQRGKDGVVEVGAGGDVGALDREMVEHAPIVPPGAGAWTPGHGGMP